MKHAHAAVLLGCLALVSGASRSEPPEERYDEPGEAQEFFAHKRAPAGEHAIPVERYLAAKRRMDGMEHFSTRARRFLAWPVAGADGEAPGPQALAQARADAQFVGDWTWLGPGNVGGRTRAFVVDPVSTNTMYAAGVAGGVWKTTNAGASWTPLDDMMANLAVSSLAMDPGDNDTLYAGTGEGFFNFDAVRGAGIFKTVDGGSSWTQLAFTGGNADFHYVNDIVVSPLNSQRLYAATRTGVFRSTNGGSSFALVLSAAGVNGCTDLALRTDQSTDVVFAACGTFTTATVYRNGDAGGSGAWQPVLSESDMARTSLAIAPSDQNVIYALASSGVPGPGGNYLHGLHAVFRSTAGGTNGSWTARVRNTDATQLNTLLLTNPPFAADCFGVGEQFSNQGWYDNVIAVDPVDSNRVWVGGIEVFRSDDGGANWGLASHWWAATSNPRYSHADRHAIVFHPNFDGGANQTLFLGTDGGIFRSTNARAGTTTEVCNTSAGSVNWTERNNNYGVTQFYYGVPYPDGNTYFGGTQDNGTNRGDDADGTDAWAQILGGDGGAVAVNPGNTNILYAENTGLSIQKSTNGGTSFSAATSGISGDSGFLFIAPFVMDPSDPQRLWTGGRFMWRTTNGAISWLRASTALGTSVKVSAIAVAPSDANFVLAGQDDGAIRRTSNGLGAGSNTTWPAAMPRGGYVSSLAFDPVNEDVAYATYSTFGGVHVWKTTNAGASWSPLDGSGAGQLPDLPYHSIVVDPGNNSRLYLGSDLGVFVSLDGGLHWAVENSGFANVITESLVVNGDELFAFTHGRGAYRVTLDPVTPPDLTIDDVNVIEGDAGVNATFTVSLSHSSTQSVTVQYATADGTAQAPADYTTTSGTLTFTPGQMSLPVVVPVVGDTLQEGNETFAVNLSNASNAGILDGQGIGTIIDDDSPGTIVLSAAAYTVGESGGTLSVVVDRLNGNKGGVTVDYASADGTAQAGSDYTAAGGTLTFGVAVGSVTFSVPITSDTIDENDETFTVALSNPTGGATLGSPSSAPVTITDDDTAGTLALSAAAYTVSESGGKATITVNRSGGAASGVTVHYATSDGSAQAGADYTSASGTLTFGAKVSKLSFTVPVANDSAIEGNETVLVALSSPGGSGVLGVPNTAVLTLTDNDFGGAFRLSKATYSVSEAAASALVTVTRTGGAASGVLVDFTTTDGTAQAPGDYGNSSGTLSFASGQTSQTVAIPIVQDTLDEANETVNLALSNPTGGATLGSPANATLTITDNDSGGVIQFSSTAASVGESDGMASLVVTRTGGSAEATVTCTTANGSATGGTDYTTTSAVLTFGAGVMSQSCTVPILPDGLQEGPETLSLSLSNPTGGASLGTKPAAVLTITDDDEAASTIYLGGTLFTVSEGAKATVTVKRSGPAASPVTVNYATSDGTAQAPGDYAAVSGTLSFAANVTSRTFTVQTAADTLDESNEDLNLTLSGPGGGAQLGTQSTGKVLITDNDAGGALQFSALNTNKAENSPTATITVTRTGGTASGVTVNYATSDGTATAGSDYTAVSGTLSFASGQKSRTFTVGLLADTLDEVNETVNLALSSPMGGATLGSPANATLTITDNDSGGAIQFSTTAASVGESDGMASLVVTRTGGSAEATVTCTTANGSATSGTDYTTTSAVLTFSAGVTTQSCTVPILPDGLQEGPETLSLGLSNPTGGASLGTKPAAVLTITDDDEAASTIYLGGTLFTVSEGAKATVTVKRSGPAASPVTVNYATSDGTAQAPGDYAAVSGTLSFAANVTSRTFTVQTAADTLDESNEDLNLTLSGPGGGAQLGTQSTGKVLITDNDAGGALQFSALNTNKAENSPTATITMTRTGGTASGVTVNYATSDGTATAGSDYTAVSGTLSFASGQKSRTFTVGLLADTLDEVNETVNLALSSPMGGATLGSPANATLTITDNDTAGSVKLSAAAYSISESGGALTVTLTRSGGTSGDVTVDYATSNGTAQAGSDYQAASGTLTFGVGETTKTFAVTVLPDAAAEPNETVNLTLSNVGGGGTLGSPATAILYIVDDD